MFLQQTPVLLQVALQLHFTEASAAWSRETATTLTLAFIFGTSNVDCQGRDVRQRNTPTSFTATSGPLLTHGWVRIGKHTRWRCVPSTTVKPASSVRPVLQLVRLKEAET